LRGTIVPKQTRKGGTIKLSQQTRKAGTIKLSQQTRKAGTIRLSKQTRKAGTIKLSKQTYYYLHTKKAAFTMKAAFITIWKKLRGLILSAPGYFPDYLPVNRG